VPFLLLLDFFDFDFDFFGFRRDKQVDFIIGTGYFKDERKM